MKPDWPDWGRPDVRGVAGIAPFRSASELMTSITELVSLAARGEGSEPELRSRAEVFELRLDAARAEPPPYARVRHALGLGPAAWWFLQAAVVWELVPLPGLGSPPTVADCARIASAIAGAPILDGIAAARGRLAWLALIELAGDGALYARRVRAAPRVLELALADEPIEPGLAIVRAPPVGPAAPEPEPALVDRIGEALGAGPPPVHVGGRASLRAIAEVAAGLGVPVVVAGAADPPGAVVREALLAGAAIAVVGGDPHHPAWGLHRHAVLLVGEPPLTY